jgi:hypothetical protein
MQDRAAPAGEPFAGLSDGQVIELAASHLHNAAMFPLGRALQKAEWAKFRRAYNEFGRREDMRVLRRLGLATCAR